MKRVFTQRMMAARRSPLLVWENGAPLFFFGEFGENKPLDSVEINGKMIGNRKIFKQEYKKSGEIFTFSYTRVYNDNKNNISYKICN